jgi:hypothetical protein
MILGMAGEHCRGVHGSAAASAAESSAPGLITAALAGVSEKLGAGGNAAALAFEGWASAEYMPGTDRLCIAAWSQVAGAHAWKKSLSQPESYSL